MSVDVVDVQRGSNMAVRKKIDPVAETRRVLREERERVRDLIARGRADEARERMRQMAEMELAEGVFVNLTDTVIEPTPEWLEKHEYRPFTPNLPDGRVRTVKTVKTVRRMASALVIRLHAKGKITDEQLAASLWYRDRFEVAGLEGRWSTTRFSNTPGGSGGGPSPMAMHEAEAEARAQYRAARDAITPFYLKFFEKVVLEDLPLNRSARFAKCRKDRVLNRLCASLNELVIHCQGNKIIIPEPGHS